MERTAAKSNGLLRNTDTEPAVVKGESLRMKHPCLPMLHEKKPASQKAAVFVQGSCLLLISPPVSQHSASLKLFQDSL